LFVTSTWSTFHDRRKKRTPLPAMAQLGVP